MKSILTTALLTVSLCASAALVGCDSSVDSIEDTDPTLDTAPDSKSDTDPGTEPDTDPAPIGIAEVDIAFNDALSAAVSGETEVEVLRHNANVVLSGELIRGDVVVFFDSLALGKGPFTVSGTATVTVRDQAADVGFSGSAVGEVTLAGSLLGELEARFPALAEFADGAADWIFGTALACQDIDLRGIVTGEPVNGRCALTDDEGEEIASMSIEDFAISIVPLGMSGSISAAGPGFDTQMVFEGLNVKILVDGEVVKDITIPNLLSGWM